MTRRRQQVMVRQDIGNMREKDETCEDENYKDETSTWTQASRTRHCRGYLHGREIVVVNFKDETYTRS